MRPRILGAVLAGGRSRRFGSDKALADLNGRALIDHAVEALRPHVDDLIVCGRDHAGCRCVADRPEPGLGPLGGLNAALDMAREEGFAGVLTTGCDCPVFPAEMARALIGDRPLVVADHQLFGYWPATFATMLDAHLAAGGDRSIRAWMRLADACTIARAWPLPNVNTPADLARLHRVESD